MSITARDRAEFRQFLRQATDRQLHGILEKEREAGREEYVELTEAELERRGLSFEANSLSMSASDLTRALAEDERDLEHLRRDIGILRAGGTVEHRTLPRALATERSLVQAIENKRALLSRLRHQGFEENARRGARTPRSWVVEQVQNDLWHQIGHFHWKRDAERFAASVPGRTRVTFTFPAGHDYAVQAPGHAPNALLRHTPEKDWRVLRITDFGPGHVYRYRIEGENLNYTPDDPNYRFYWRVPDLDDPRYDLSSAERVEHTPRYEANVSARGLRKRVEKRHGPSFLRAYEFFKEHAGGPVGRSAETASALARAEEEAASRGWRVDWEHDEYPDTSWMSERELEDYRSGRLEILAGLLKDETGTVLESIGGVSVYGDQAGRNFTRIEEANMALEALSREGWKP